MSHGFDTRCAECGRVMQPMRTPDGRAVETALCGDCTRRAEYADFMETDRQRHAESQAIARQSIAQTEALIGDLRIVQSNLNGVEKALLRLSQVMERLDDEVGRLCELVENRVQG